MQEGGPESVPWDYALRDEAAIREKEERDRQAAAIRAQFFPYTNAAIGALGNAIWESLPERPHPTTPQFLKLPFRVLGILPPIDRTVATNLNTGQRCEYYKDDEGTTYNSLEVREPPMRVVFEEEDEPEGTFACCVRPK